jgi:hypothetical protein
MPHFSIKNNSKIQENHIMPYHLFLLKNNLKNSSSMLRHISPLKNKSKNSRKSPHPASYFSIEK